MNFFEKHRKIFAIGGMIGPFLYASIWILGGIMGKKRGNSRKYGRNKDKCKTYRDYDMREKNKARKIRRHLKKHSQDDIALAALKRLN